MFSCARVPTCCAPHELLLRFFVWLAFVSCQFNAYFLVYLQVTLFHLRLSITIFFSTFPSFQTHGAVATRLPLPVPYLGGTRLVYWEVSIESPAVAHLFKSNADAVPNNSTKSPNVHGSSSGSVLASVAIGVALPGHDVREPLGGQSSFAITIDLLNDGSTFSPAVLLRYPHHATSPAPTANGSSSTTSSNTSSTTSTTSTSVPVATKPVQGVPWEEKRKGCGAKYIGAGGASNRPQGSSSSNSSSFASALTVGVILDLVSGHLFYALAPRSLVSLDPDYGHHHDPSGGDTTGSAGSAAEAGSSDALLPPRPARCPKDHPLAWFRSQNGGTCDGCQQRHSQGEAFMFCKSCNFCLCCDCTPVRTIFVAAVFCALKLFLGLISDVPTNLICLNFKKKRADNYSYPNKFNFAF